MTVVVSEKKTGYAGNVAPNEGTLLLYPKHVPARRRGIICLHGRGGDSTQYAPIYEKWGPGYFADLLAREGFIVLAIDASGATNWGNDDAMAMIDAAYGWLTGPWGGCEARVGVMGWSMGGLGGLNWIARNPDKLSKAWFWAPATDLDWFQANGTYAAEINAAYDGNYAVNGQGYNPTERPGDYDGDRIRIRHAADDATIPVAQSQAFAAAIGATIDVPATSGHAPFGASNLDVARHFIDNP